MTIRDLLRSRTLAVVLCTLGVILIVMVIFSAGMYTGYHRALFTYHWNESYMRRPDDPRSFFAPFRVNEVQNSHGAVGEIVSVNLPLVVVKGPYEAEKIIVVGPHTSIRNFHDAASTSDLVLGRQILAIGEPDDSGRIDATLIRIVPPPPSPDSTSTQSHSNNK